VDTTAAPFVRLSRLKTLFWLKYCERKNIVKPRASKDSERISSKICLPGGRFCKRDPGPGLQRMYTFPATRNQQDRERIRVIDEPIGAHTAAASTTTVWWCGQAWPGHGHGHGQDSPGPYRSWVFGSVIISKI